MSELPQKVSRTECVRIFRRSLHSGGNDRFNVSACAAVRESPALRHRQIRKHVPKRPTVSMSSPGGKHVIGSTVVHGSS